MKRLLLFLLLLALGFAVLHFAVADDRPATAGTAPSAERQVPQGQPIRLQGGSSGMTAQMSGPLKIVQTRLVPTADGKRKEPCMLGPKADCNGCGCIVPFLTRAQQERSDILVDLTRSAMRWL